MKKSKEVEVFNQLMANVAAVKFGSVSVTFKKHDGRIVEVTYLTSEQRKEPKNELNDDD